MAELVRGAIILTDLRELLMLTEALRSLEDRYRRGGLHLPEIALDLQRKVAELTTAATAARHNATSARNRNDNVSTGSGEVVNVKQAAELIGISPQAVRKNCATGRLDAAKAPGSSWLITRDSIDRLAYEKEHK